MIRVALSNLWNRRGRYAWLLLELMAVTVICWAVIDPLIVLSRQYAESVGYDRDRICLVYTSIVNRKDRAFMPERDLAEHFVTDRMRILSALRELPQVEYATPVYSGNLMDVRFSSWSFNGTEQAYTIRYTSGQDFFRTFGITAPGEERTIDYLSDLSPVGRSVVLTRSDAARKYPGVDPVAMSDSLIEAARHEHPTLPEEELPERVVGVVDDVKPRSTVSGAYWVSFKPMESIRNDAIAVRVCEGESVEAFMRYVRDMAGTLHEGNVRVTGVRSYNDLSTEFQNRESGPERRLNSIFAVFFLLNVSLGVVGTFWMMTRRRAGEVGVLRAFGSDRKRVMGLLSVEALILAFTGWAAGCLIYFYYAWHHGLYTGKIENAGLVTSWVESFLLHFSIISAIILPLLALAVIIGVAGPGWKLSRINPVDALRSE